MEFVRDLPERPDHFRVAGMSDQDQLIALGMITVDLVMDLDDEWTCRIDDLQAPPLGLFPDGLGDAVRAEDHGLAVRNFAQLLDEHRSLQLERVHNMPAVDDLVPDIDRRTI